MFLYLAYAPQDQALLQQLLRHLTGLLRVGQIDIWSDLQLGAGEDWQQSKQEALLRAQVILLLVSADFLSNTDIYEQEVKIAMAQHEAGKARVIPIVLRECMWQYESYAHLQSLPPNGEPVLSDSWATTDDAFTEIVEQLAKVLKEDQSKPQSDGLISDGHFVDPRDGQRYPVCKFAGKTWLGKNLNFALDSGYRVYGDEPENAMQHGGLYTWEAAQQACPPGWRLATEEDWQSLIDYFGNAHLAYKHLLGGGDSLLNMSLGGKYSTHSHQYVLGEECGFYWCSKEYNYEQAFYYMFDNGMASLRQIAVDKKTGASCRYVLDPSR